MPKLASVKSMVQKSRFIFLGRALRIGGTGILDQIPPENTAIVRVDRVLLHPRELENFGTNEILVTFRPGTVPKLQEDRVFFTDSLVHGPKLRVSAIGHRITGGNDGQLEEKIRSAREDMARTGLDMP